MATKRKTKRKAKQSPIPVRRGRPSDYTNEIADFICNIISSSSKGLATILLENPQLPDHSTIYRWLEREAYFREQYSRARLLQADFMADEIRAIADTPVEGITTTEKEWGVEIQKSDALGHRRLQVEARKWLMSKLHPKKYGDKVDITTDGEKIPQTIIKWGDKEIAV